MTKYLETKKNSLEDAVLRMKEKLVGGQKKLDKDKDGDIDGKDFAMLRKQKKNEELENERYRYLETKKGSVREAVLKIWGEISEKVEYVEYKFKNKNDAMAVKRMLDGMQMMKFDVNDDNISNGELMVDAGSKDMTKYHKEVMSKFRPKVMTQESSKLGASRKSMNDVKEQLTAINQRKLSMRDALRQVWSGQEAKNPFDNGQKVKKERKDFAKGAKAATGEPAAKVEIDPKIKD